MISHTRESREGVLGGGGPLCGDSGVQALSIPHLPPPQEPGGLFPVAERDGSKEKSVRPCACACVCVCLSVCIWTTGTQYRWWHPYDKI